MLWLVINDASHQIISCNIHIKDGKHQLWVTRPNGKSLLIKESEDKDKVQEIKDAIDYAIEAKDPVLRLA